MRFGIGVDRGAEGVKSGFCPDAPLRSGPLPHASLPLPAAGEASRLWRDLFFRFATDHLVRTQRGCLVIEVFANHKLYTFCSPQFWG